MTDEIKKEEVEQKEPNPVQIILDEISKIRDEHLKGKDSNLTKFAEEVEKYSAQKFGSTQGSKDLHYYSVLVFSLATLIHEEVPIIPRLAFSTTFEILKDALIKVVAQLTKKEDEKEKPE